MKRIITIILMLTTLSISAQTLPELVEMGFNDEFINPISNSSIVDFDNINQKKINKLIVKKLRTIQMIHNPLTIVSSGKQHVSESAVKAAKHHTIYQFKHNRLGHNENSEEFKTFSHRYKFYADGDFGSVITKGELCTKFKIKGKISYNKLVNMILNSYMDSKAHKEILLENNDKKDIVGSYVIVGKNGYLYNTIVFP